MKEYFVYMLLCEGQSIYTGYTVDLQARIKKHFSGRGGAKYTRAFRPLKVLCAWQVSGNKGNSMRIEAFIKSLSVSDKRELAGSPGDLNRFIADSGRAGLWGLEVETVPVDHIVVE